MKRRRIILGILVTLAAISALLWGVYYEVMRTNWHGYADERFITKDDLNALTSDELIAKGTEAIQRGNKSRKPITCGWDDKGYYSANPLQLFAEKCFDLAVRHSDARGEGRVQALSDAAYWRYMIRPDEANLDRSIQQLKEALEIAPSNSRTLTMLAAVTCRRYHGSPDSTTECNAYLQNALDARPDYGDAWYLKSQMLSDTPEERFSDLQNLMKHLDTLDPFISKFGVYPPQEIIGQVRHLFTKFPTSFPTTQTATTR